MVVLTGSKSFNGQTLEKLCFQQTIDAKQAKKKRCGQNKTKPKKDTDGMEIMKKKKTDHIKQQVKKKEE